MIITKELKKNGIYFQGKSDSLFQETIYLKNDFEGVYLEA